MLPSAKNYLIEGGLSPEASAYATIGCFLGGVVGIQFVSRLLHHYIPSHVVDCDHSHDEDGSDGDPHEEDAHEHDHPHKHNGHATEDTPLLSQHDIDLKTGSERRSRSATVETTQLPDALYVTSPSTRRPSFQTRLTSRMSTFVSGAKSSCDQGGPCYGYSEPCCQECFKVASRSPTKAPTRTFGRFSISGQTGQPSLFRTATSPYYPTKGGPLPDYDEEAGRSLQRLAISRKRADAESEASTKAMFRGRESGRDRAPSHLSTEMSTDDAADELANGKKRNASRGSVSVASTANDPSHHHHVPTNAFLAIGLQTSIAIALHKLPEGFITYATNHANPKLGFTVFMALFIHNITEGFAMALPLYLAINSRWKAMFWSSLLGGVSQPLGAGVAALWFKIAGRGDMAPGDVVYGCMFSITAGIMASVALQLFSEGLSLTHNRNLCTAFAFIGMGILGISFALTAS
ncbi:hypothetical protein MMC28_006907 [Mycoblastus sanguinarius]|nr:hypothetical protein [Mycoblastus sanguinarius]